MSRMIALAILGIFATNLIHATDVGKYPPGHKPFHSPKAPVPNGVFAIDSCFGFHATRWTPWQAACDSSCSTVGVGSSVTNKAIILFETPAAPQKMPAPSVLVPAPEASKPMPPAKK